MSKNTVIFMDGKRVWVATSDGRYIDFKNNKITESTRGRINRLIRDGKIRMILCSFNTWAINRNY